MTKFMCDNRVQLILGKTLGDALWQQQDSSADTEYARLDVCRGRHCPDRQLEGQGRCHSQSSADTAPRHQPANGGDHETQKPHPDQGSENWMERGQRRGRHRRWSGRYEGPADFLDDRKGAGVLTCRKYPRTKLRTGTHQWRKGDEKLHRRRQPDPIPHGCAVVLQGKRQQPSHDEAKRRLPEVRKQGVQINWDHHGASFFAFFRRVLSASLTSSRVSSPDSTRCAITSLARPPSIASSSSINRRCASSREITASKIFALLIRLMQRKAFFRSSRYTVVCTVV